MHPYKMDGRRPSPKMSVWAQRKVVTKPYDVNLRKPVPGYQFKQLPMIGLINALKGIGTRGGPSGIDQGMQTSGNDLGGTPGAPASNIPGLMTPTEDGSSDDGLYPSQPAVSEPVDVPPNTASQGQPSIGLIPNEVVQWNTRQSGVGSEPSIPLTGNSFQDLYNLGRTVENSYDLYQGDYGNLLRNFGRDLFRSPEMTNAVLTGMGYSGVVSFLRTNTDATQLLQRAFSDFVGNSANVVLNLPSTMNTFTGAITGGPPIDEVLQTIIDNPGTAAAYSLVRGFFDFLLASTGTLSTGSAISRLAGRVAPYIGQAAQTFSAISPGGRARLQQGRYNLRPQAGPSRLM
jgi:hypothetical protein